MKIYTRGGDKGLTSLFGGIRVPKNNARVSAYGSFDELNSWLGFSLNHCEEHALRVWVLQVQRDLFTLGSWIASPKACVNIRDGKDPWDGSESKTELPVNLESIAAMENQIDQWEQSLKPLKNFILPGGSNFASALHFARTICRRAERECVAMKESGEETPALVIQYLNRLADALFVAARFVNQQEGIQEEKWS